MNTANEVVHSTSFMASLRVQRRVIGALLMREIHTRYGRHNIGFLWVFAEPMLFVLGVITMWTTMKQLHRLHVPMVPFLVTGYTPLLLWRHCTNRALLALTINASLLYHRNVRAADIFIARMLLEIAGAVAAFFIISLSLGLMGLMSFNGDLFILCVGWLLLSWFATAFSMLLCAYSERTELVDKFWHPISYLILPLSGVFYMVDWLPAGIRPIALSFPLVNVIEMVRSGAFGTTVRTYYSIPYVILICMVLTVWGLWSLKRAHLHMEPQ